MLYAALLRLGLINHEKSNNHNCNCYHESLSVFTWFNTLKKELLPLSFLRILDVLSGLCDG